MSKELLQKNFRLVIGLIRDSRLRALKTVNRELINLYWQIGSFCQQKS